MLLWGFAGTSRCQQKSWQVLQHGSLLPGVESQQEGALSQSWCKLLAEWQGCAISLPGSWSGCPLPPLLFAQGEGAGVLSGDNVSVLIKCFCCLPARSAPGRCSALQCVKGVGCLEKKKKKKEEKS